MKQYLILAFICTLSITLFGQNQLFYKAKAKKMTNLQLVKNAEYKIDLGGYSLTEKEIDDILSLFNEYKKSDDIVKLIDNTDTPEDILDDFVSTFIEETPKWKLEHDNDI